MTALPGQRHSNQLVADMAPLLHEHDRLRQLPEVKAFLMLDRGFTDEVRNTSPVAMTTSVLYGNSSVKSFLAIEQVIENLTATINNMREVDA